MEKGKEPSESGNLMDTIHPLSKAASVPSFAEENPRGQYKRRVREEDQADASPGVESASLFRARRFVRKIRPRNDKLHTSLTGEHEVDASCGEKVKATAGFRYTLVKRSSSHGEGYKHPVSRREVSGANPELEIELPNLWRMHSLVSFTVDDGVDASHGEVSKGLSGITCSDCLDFQLDLATTALEYHVKRKNDPVAFDKVRVYAACFLNSWPRSHFSRFKFTDKCHISFSAELKNSGFDDVSKTWFFAELLETDNGDFRPTICEKMDPADPGITYGCGYCPPEKKFPHPPGYEQYFNRRQPARLCKGDKAVGFKHHHRLVGVSGGSEHDSIKLEKNKRLSEIDAANAALTYKDMDSLYEVEEVIYLEKMPFAWVEMDGANLWYHVGFTARPKNSSQSDASSKHLFGELRFCEDTQSFVPTLCCIMETSDSGLSRGCGFCPPNDRLLHPGDGYKCGSWAVPPSLEVPTPSEFYSF